MGRASTRAWSAIVLLVAVIWSSAVSPVPATASAGPPAPSPPAAEARADVDVLRDRIDTEIARYVGGSTPGMAVAVVDRNGPLVLRAAGAADPVDGVPLTTRSRFPVASVSKVVTALTALSLHRSGDLDLDSDVSELTGVTLRDLREPADRAPVTGRHLLTHRSGIEEPVVVHPDPPRKEADVAPMSGPWLSAHPPVLRYPPGPAVHYSALQGYALLGAAVERATGRPFESTARSTVLDPVGATTARFSGVSTPAAGDVVMADRDGSGWRAALWPPVRERPAGGLAWSVVDAAALSTALLRDDGTLHRDVVAEALGTSVRPPQGSGGHTGVFFEQYRHGQRSLEHPGGNGVAWMAVLPEAGIAVFAAVTTEDSAAVSVPPAVVDLAAAWAVETGRVPPRADSPVAGRPTIWPPDDRGLLAPAAPIGTFQGRVFDGRGPERALRVLATEMVVTADGEDLLANGRRFVPAVPGRWCDAEGCLAGLRSPGGVAMLLRSDGGMMEHVLVQVPWWSSRTAVLAGVGAGTLSILLFGVGAVVRRVRRRAVRDPAAVLPLRLACGATAFALALVAATPIVLGFPLVAGGNDWIAATGVTLTLLRVGFVLSLALAVAALCSAVLGWRRMLPARRVGSVGALLVAMSVQGVLALWTF